MNNLISRTLTVTTMMVCVALAAAQNIGVSVDGRQVDFGDQQPVYRDGRVLVPLRGVFEQMGASVKWEPETQTVLASTGTTEVKLMIGSRTAYVNNQPTALDVPAMLIGGRTVVPLRFVSESMGADVHWFDSTRQVVITTARAGVVNPPSGGVVTTEPMKREVRIENDTVLPVSLNEQLSSATTRAGEKFTATIKKGGKDNYAGLPSGSRVMGEVVSARPKTGNDPGILELRFDELKLPDGRTFPLYGSLIDLNDKNIETRSNGELVAKGGSRQDKRLVYAGIGAGAGLIVGYLTKKPIEGGIIGGILGYLAGEWDRNKKSASDVVLEKGTRFGVALDRDLVFTIRDTNK